MQLDRDKVEELGADVWFLDDFGNHLNGTTCWINPDGTYEVRVENADYRRLEGWYTVKIDDITEAEYLD